MKDTVRNFAQALCVLLVAAVSLVHCAHCMPRAVGEKRFWWRFRNLQAEKVYVQQRVREAGDRVWELLQGGAHVYICGDAGAMAPDVHEALLDVISEHQVDHSLVYCPAFIYFK